VAPVDLQPAPPVRHSLLTRAFEGTPGKLRAAAIVGVVVSLLFALLGANAFRSRGEALDAARTGADQVVRVQKIASDMAQADAVVTNAFLLGGNAGTGGLQQFDQYVAAASKGIAEASRAEPGDADALAAVNESLTRYSAAIASATANNRLGNEVGSAYLRQASQLLRTPTNDTAAILPTLQSVADTDAQRVDDAFADASRSLVYLLAAGVVVLGALLAVQVWLARRTRRILNVPLTAGTGTVLVALVLGAIVMLTSQSAANTVRDTHYAATKALAQARIAAFDAKANESLTLVYRGTGQAFETAWQKQFGAATQNLAVAGRAGVADPGTADLEAWGDVHRAIRTSDDAGDWDKAVARATGTGQQDSPTVFAKFADTSRTAVDTESAAVREGLGSNTLLVVLGWLTLGLGLVAAVLAWRGIAQRLEEYR
jgi:hypothetical protein